MSIVFTNGCVNLYYSIVKIGTVACVWCKVILSINAYLFTFFTDFYYSLRTVDLDDTDDDADFAVVDPFMFFFWL